MTSTVSIIIWLPILASVISASVSIVSAYALDKRKERKEDTSKKIEVYRRIFDEFYDSSIKLPEKGKVFRDYLLANRHYLDQGFRIILPTYFDPLFVVGNDYRTSFILDYYNKDAIFLDIDGNIFYVRKGKIKEYDRTSYYFVEPKEAELWRTMAESALSNYNALTGDKIELDKYRRWHIDSIERENLP